MTSCFVLEQPTQVPLSLVAQHVFSTSIRVQRGSGMTRVRQTHPLTRLSQPWLGLAWLARWTAQWRSCESTLRTHRHAETKTDSWKQNTRTHDSTERRSVHS